MLEYISAPEAAKKWGISERRVQKLCEENCIPGNVKEESMNPKILLINDEDSIYNMIKLYFETEGYLVYTALDSDEAVNSLSNKPDLILLDINMPEVDGLEFCKRIRNHVDCPIIFLTSRITEQDKVVGYYITKSFSPGELTARVGAHLRRECRTRHSDIKHVGRTVY